MNKKHAFNEKELMVSLQETLAHAKDKLTLKTTMLPNSPGKMSPTKIALIRRKLKVSTPVFAAYLNVSADTVRGWADKLSKRSAVSACRIRDPSQLH